MRCLVLLCLGVLTNASIDQKQEEKFKTNLRTGENCVDCDKRHVINLDEDFSKLKSDPELSQHVSAILTRLKTFKIPAHPRIRIFYELLKVGMKDYAHRTADSLYVPDKYNTKVENVNPS